jgi:hypothetical protein
MLPDSIAVRTGELGLVGIPRVDLRRNQSSKLVERERQREAREA